MTYKPKIYFCFFMLFSFVLPSSSVGASDDPLIEGSRQCTEQFPINETKFEMPTHLLAAIATTETGKWHEGLGLSVPWPWTLKVGEKKYYYKNRAEAVANTKKAIEDGQKNIAVGCMALTPRIFSSLYENLEDAFVPENNVTYAAKFMRSNYDGSGDWIKAAAAYHSDSPKEGREYLAKIEKTWNRIVAKVARARTAKLGDICGDIVTLLDSRQNIKPQKGCIYRDGNMSSSLRVFQVTEDWILVRTTLHPYSSKIGILYKDNEHENGAVDDSIIDTGLFQYAGVVSYPTATVDKSVYSFKRVGLK